MAKKKVIELDRIPHKSRINTSLSIARYSGWCNINGIHYEYDREIVQKMHDDTDKSILYQPDLVAYGDINKWKLVLNTYQN